MHFSACFSLENVEAKRNNSNMRCVCGAVQHTCQLFFRDFLLITTFLGMAAGQHLLSARHLRVGQRFSSVLIRNPCGETKSKENHLRRLSIFWTTILYCIWRYNVFIRNLAEKLRHKDPNRAAVEGKGWVATVNSINKFCLRWGRN